VSPAPAGQRVGPHTRLVGAFGHERAVVVGRGRVGQDQRQGGRQHYRRNRGESAHVSIVARPQLQQKSWQGSCDHVDCGAGTDTLQGSFRSEHDVLVDCERFTT
jgi:hypothetical protein